MLPYEWMGVLALGVLWVNTLLVVAAALKRARPLLVRARAFRRLAAGEVATGVVRGRLRGDGPRAELAIEQTGRVATGSAQAIVWHDRSYTSALSGGELVHDDVVYDIEETTEIEVWPADARVAAAHACEGEVAFDAAFADAQKARGVKRVTRAVLEADQEVYVFGKVERRSDDRYVISPPEGQKLVVAEVDPGILTSRRAATISLVLVPLMLLGAAICTALALTPPRFDGWISKAGGLLGFIFFLLVLPAGTAINDYARLPHERILRGRWNDPRGRSRPIKSASVKPSA